MKKIISLFLASIMLLALVPFSQPTVSNEFAGKTATVWVYKKNEASDSNTVYVGTANVTSERMEMLVSEQISASRAAESAARQATEAANRASQQAQDAKSAADRNYYNSLN